MAQVLRETPGNGLGPLTGDPTNALGLGVSPMYLGGHLWWALPGA